MLKKKTAFVLALSTLAIGGAAFAGARNSRDIYVGDSFFNGAFGTIRNSTSTSSWLRCELNNRGTYTCDAYDGVKYKSCSGSDAGIRSSLEGMGGEDDLYVAFSGGTCTTVYVTKSSVNEPKR